MKIKNAFLFATVSLLTLGFESCKKDNSNATATAEIETSYELSSDDAVSENMTNDANDVLMEASVDNNFAGRNSGVASAQTMNNLSCAVVTVLPLEGFPKHISIDFGTGCTSQNGVTRKGKIYITISDSLRKSGSVSVMTFADYYVNGYKIEGTTTWTNTSHAGIISWRRTTENGKITAANGTYWLHSGVKEVVQTEGASTPHNLLDDVYSITGHHTVTNAHGETRTSLIIEPLEKKTICENIDKGKIQTTGPHHTAVLDFGDGTCDRIATISIDGKTPRTIMLR